MTRAGKQAPVTWYAVELADGMQEHRTRKPVADEPGVVRWAATRRAPAVDGSQLWDFAARRWVASRAVVRGSASQAFCAARSRPGSDGAASQVQIQHLRKEMLARLHLAGFAITGSVVALEAAALGLDLTERCHTIIAKAQAADAQEVARITARAI